MHLPSNSLVFSCALPFHLLHMCNPVNARQNIPVGLQRHAISAAQNCSIAEADITICCKAALTSLFKAYTIVQL